VLVIDRKVSESAGVCAALREDGHMVEARAYGDDLLGAVASLQPQVIAIRMRLGGMGRTVRARIQRAFPHIRIVSFNRASLHTVRAQMPERWTDLYQLSAPLPPRMYGFPRAIREAYEEALTPMPRAS
jgi:hypothetical protein